MIHITKNLPADNNQYYIEHEEGTSTFTLGVDPDHKNNL